MSDPNRFNRPWPHLLDFIFDANMTNGTSRMIGLIVLGAVLFGSLLWLVDS
ncbi:hypothetical protein [Mangrovicella endophytica]|uniref:hypothetical protein n=1 Tax=Mangrovicella endophytica TaxID=2066697 RepID=UPI0012FFE05B|nr:hypothetical protein [Mangrovicella endophytica]